MIGFISETIYRLIYPLLLIFLKHGNYSDEAIKLKNGYVNFNNPSGSKVIMFHGVSVGEINAIEKLIKKTREVFSNSKIVVTTGTNTGQEIAHKKLDECADLITYFPFDTPSCVKRFLDNVKPDIILIAETEIWPNIGIECKKRGIKLCIINGRISDRTYNSYKKLKFFFKPLLKNYSGIYTQSSEDLEKFLSLGANKETTERMNNLKFDITAPDVNFEFDKSGRVFLAASTHTGEDEIILEVFQNLKSKHEDLKLIIAPRHLTRIDEVENLVGQSGFSYEFRSKGVNSMEDIDILILDTMGELSKMFAYSDISFIGGSFNKTGGHNPLESIIFSKPVISGPSIHNFKDIYAIIQNANAGFVVKNRDDFTKIADKLLSDKDFYNKTSKFGDNVFKSQQGALNFVIELIGKFIK
mgnify:CR=1 FL=1